MATALRSWWDARGTGKTFALGVARAAWQQSGHAVLGVAVARRAADELASGAGIESTSVAALLGDLDGHEEKLPERCALVVDEAGMVPTRQVALLLDHVETLAGNIVLVGDHRQLPAPEAGGAFRGLVQRGLAIGVTENRRQVERWERSALEHLRDVQGCASFVGLLAIAAVAAPPVLSDRSGTEQAGLLAGIIAQTIRRLNLRGEWARGKPVSALAALAGRRRDVSRPSRRRGDRASPARSRRRQNRWWSIARWVNDQ